ncbi:MAG: decarboxylating 6-phosphogluconate dehydrogenase [Chloroflexi bacterium]|nr:decarboxylating 6-phosphogluconate dehydrogenase [Chloroflexota bacterium]
MDLGMVGLGRMGGNMTLRLVRGGHRVVVFDPREEAVDASVRDGAIRAQSLANLVSSLLEPRVVWVMVPAGDATQQTIDALASLLAPGDLVIDGGNSNYKDTMRRAATLKEHGLDLLDAGTSGGVWGLTEGYSLMVGGDAEAYERARTIFETLAPAADRGVGRVGPAGAGHFVKMVHNGIEYGLMQAFAEGFEILQAKKEFALDLKEVGAIWQHGSVVRSWLLDLAVEALSKDPDLSTIQGYVSDSGEGRWTIQEAIDLDVPADVITLSLFRRFRSRQADSFSDRMLAALRNEFGGHAVRRVP